MDPLTPARISFPPKKLQQQVLARVSTQVDEATLRSEIRCGLSWVCCLYGPTRVSKSVLVYINDDDPTNQPTDLTLTRMHQSTNRTKPNQAMPRAAPRLGSGRGRAVLCGPGVGREGVTGSRPRPIRRRGAVGGGGGAVGGGGGAGIAGVGWMGYRG